MYSDWEHLVCSDGKHEPAVEWSVQAIGDGRRKYLHLPQQLGHFGAGVRSALTDVAAGDYLAFLDDDNLIFPKFAAYMVNALEKHPEAGFAICQIVQTVSASSLNVWGLRPRLVINGIPPGDETSIPCRSSYEKV